MVSAQSKGWVIGEYTGDPYKDKKISFGTVALSSNTVTITVDGAIESAIAIGTTGAAALGVRCSSSAAQLAAGTAIFYGSAAAADTIHYQIFHKGLK